MTTIAHLSDPHLDGSSERLRRLARVLDEVAALPDVALIAVTGDIADHGQADEYTQFFDHFAPTQPTVVIPGNHDLRAPLSQHLAPDTHGFLNTVATTGGVTVIGLDSLVEGHAHGLLADDTLTFARGEIAKAAGPVVLALHHPPVPVGHAVMDQYGLHNPRALAALVNDSSAVIAVLTGHVTGWPRIGRPRAIDGLCRNPHVPANGLAVPHPSPSGAHSVSHALASRAAPIACYVGDSHALPGSPDRDALTHRRSRLTPSNLVWTG